ncbi:uncharacterized protein PG998_011568 [Apiospora kogelbergensis]|uniref:Hemerythrin-like domain-containing protein n=1 Tax=Apiospora kogelbergensis TaxID=1337665 RepID=A0AAW0RBH8_9PEZI
MDKLLPLCGMIGNEVIEISPLHPDRAIILQELKSIVTGIEPLVKDLDAEELHELKRVVEFMEPIIEHFGVEHLLLMEEVFARTLESLGAEEVLGVEEVWGAENKECASPVNLIFLTGFHAEVRWRKIDLQAQARFYRRQARGVREALRGRRIRV